MTQGVEYAHDRAIECIRRAEEWAGASVLGYLYRFEWNSYHSTLMLQAFRISKKTPKGWKILINSYRSFRAGKTQQVLEGTRKQFARPTVEAALESYRLRKMRYQMILKHKLKDAEASWEAGAAPAAYEEGQSQVKRELAFLIGGEEFHYPVGASPNL